MLKQSLKRATESQLLNEWSESLRNDSQNRVILVEGKKDKKALEGLGAANILIINKPLYKMIEEIIGFGRECIILVDLDKEGKKIYSKISSKLREAGIKVDNRYREFLFKTKLRQIEGITHYLNTIEPYPTEVL